VKTPLLTATNVRKDLVEISRFLSYVLRHRPDSIGLKLDCQGWAPIADLIAGARGAGHQLDERTLREVVGASDKRRFAISPDGQRIRAVQGHSTKAVAITFPKVTPPNLLFHGTAQRFVESILLQGLNPGDRQYVHLSEDRQVAMDVGKRYGEPAVLSIDSRRMYQDGADFFLAENGVWLVLTVPAKYLSEA
jgi:putative RNA 2'-phosphotransferase